MKTEKRSWIYTGLGVPDGVALVAPPRKNLPQARVLLVGNEDALGLVAPMEQLAADDKQLFHTELSIGSSLKEWTHQTESKKLGLALTVFRPTVVLVVLDPRDTLLRQLLSSRVRRAQANDLWLVPPGISWRPTKRFIPATDTSVHGYAAWAGRAWANLVE